MNGRFLERGPEVMKLSRQDAVADFIPKGDGTDFSAVTGRALEVFIFKMFRRMCQQQSGQCQSKEALQLGSDLGFDVVRVEK